MTKENYLTSVSGLSAVGWGAWRWNPARNPLMVFTYYSKPNDIIQCDLSISNIKSNSKVYEGNHTVLGEARIQIDQAEVCATLGKESKQIWKKVVLHSVHEKI